ncbi:Hint domain-containing protein [Kibdelosporangium lantanae]|uniref:Hint domain-containing protein n=1 Tax=Kibdelosporangium lantanae TaxID=1497396 RepID=A0ABW3M2C7_9PSEU
MGDDRPYDQCPGCGWENARNAHQQQAAAINQKAKAGQNSVEYKQAKEAVKKSKWQVFIEAAGDLVKSLIGWDDIADCVTHGAFGACVRTLINIIPWGKILKTGEIVADFWKGARALMTFGKEVEKAEKVIVETERVLVDAERAAADAEKVAADAERAAAETEHAAQEAKSTEAAESGGGVCHSFPAGTRVLLADGTAKPIEQVQSGDSIASTDPQSGVTASQTVVATWLHEDEPDRTELTIDTDGNAGTATATISATDWHPIWVAELKSWIPITQVRTGSWLQTPAGAKVQVTAVLHINATDFTYDLTVETTHTYFVLAGTTPVLVHNCSEPANPHELKPTHQLSGDASTKKVKEYRDAMRRDEFNWEESPISVVKK